MRVVVSDTNQGPIVNIAAWFGTTVMVLGVCTRLWSKHSAARNWTMDDAMIVITMILGCVTTATITLTVANGVGRPQSSLSNSQIVKLEQYGYASQLLYFPTICVAKLTTLIYLHELSPERSFAVLNTILGAFIILWSVAAELAIAFPCRLPTPWATITGKCYNQTSFWRANGSLDILTDIMITLLPLYLVWSLRMSKRRKMVVTMAFGCRLLVIPLTAWRITSFSQIDPQDITFSLYHIYLTTTIQLNFAIFMACVTFLRPFLESTSSGGMAITVNSTTNSKTFSSFFTLSRPRSYHQKSTIVDTSTSYSMQNLSEVHLNENESENQNASSLRKSDSTTTADSPSSIHTYESPPAEPHSNINTNTYTVDDLGPLRPDRVASFSRVSNPPVDIGAHLGHNRERGISKIMEWGIQQEARH